MARKLKAQGEPDLSYISEPLRRFAVPINTLELDPKNARRHSEQNIQSIIDSLREFKQRLLIVVQKEGMVVRAGNGRVIAARKLGWSHIAALVVDEKDIDATAFALADNRTAELASWDYVQLLQQFETLSDQGVDITHLGWNQAELDSLMSASFRPDPLGAIPTPDDKRTIQFTREQLTALEASHKAAKAKEPLAAWIVSELT